VLALIRISVLMPALGSQRARPAAASSSAVSNSGNPMTPEKLPRKSATNTAARPWMA
jgi:hypothetical protein